MRFMLVALLALLFVGCDKKIQEARVPLPAPLVGPISA